MVELEIENSMDGYGMKLALSTELFLDCLTFGELACS